MFPVPKGEAVTAWRFDKFQRYTPGQAVALALVIVLSMAVSSWPLLLIFCLVGPGVIVSYILALKGASAAEIDDLFAGISVRLFTPAQGRASSGRGARDKERGQQSQGQRETRGARQQCRCLPSGHRGRCRARRVSRSRSCRRAARSLSATGTLTPPDPPDRCRPGSSAACAQHPVCCLGCITAADSQGLHSQHLLLAV